MLVCKKEQFSNLKEKIGAKAYNLYILKKYGFPTVDGVSIIGPISDEDIAKAWYTFPEGTKLAVRSSMKNEDGENYSMAGKYKTVLGVSSFSDFKSAVQKSINYSDKKENVSLLIQPMVNSYISGVLFTSVAKENPNIYIESTYGLGEIIVGGYVEPDKYYINYENMETSKTISQKKLFGFFLENEKKEIGQLIKYPFGDVRKITSIGKGKFVGSMSYTVRRKSSLTEKYLLELIQLAKRIEQLFGTPQDVEWAIDDDGIKILQSRNITREISPVLTIKKNNRNNNKMFGISASKGKIQGVIKKDLQQNEVTENPFIYVGYEMKPEILYQLDKVKGIITESGGLLCHAAIVAREIEIPCIVGIEGVLDSLEEGDKIFLNADEGYVVKI